MRLTTKGRFAVTAMIDLAMPRRAGRSRSPRSANARRFRCPIWSSCSASCAGTRLVTSVRGPGGGYRLAKQTWTTCRWPTSSGRWTSRSTRPSADGRENCHDDQKCITHDLWAEPERAHLRVPALGDAGPAGRARQNAEGRTVQVSSRTSAPRQRPAADRASCRPERDIRMAITLTESAARQIRSSLAEARQGLGLAAGRQDGRLLGLRLHLRLWRTRSGANDALFEGARRRSSSWTSEALAVPRRLRRSTSCARASRSPSRSKNPNVEDTCGCGESFSVKADRGRLTGHEQRYSRTWSNQPYEHGFVTDIESDTAPKGLSTRTSSGSSRARRASRSGCSSSGCKAYRHWLTMTEPTWPNVKYPKIDFQDIIYYSAPKAKKKLASMDEVDPELLPHLREARRAAERAEGARRRGGRRDLRLRVGRRPPTRRSSPRSASSSARSRRRCASIPSWCASTSARVVPDGDNFYAALNSAVFTDGSFCYIPKGVRCPMELSTYFRINTAGLRASSSAR